MGRRLHWRAALPQERSPGDYRMKKNGRSIGGRYIRGINDDH